MRRFSFKSYLALLVAAAVVPLALFAAGMVRWAASDSRRDAEHAQANLVESLTLAIEGELRANEAVLDALATSPVLAKGDLAAFDAYARKVGAQRDSWIVLNDAQAQQLINTRLPPGSVLPRSGTRTLIDSVFATRRTQISDVFIGVVAPRPLVSVMVPVSRDGEVRYALDMPFAPERLSRLLASPALPAQTVATLLDSKSTIVARSHDAATYAGKPAPDWLRQAVAEGRQFASGARPDGVEAVIAFRALSIAPWTLVVAQPKAALSAGPDRALNRLGAGALVFIILAVAGAALLGRRLARSIQALARAAPTMLEGRTPATLGPAPAEIAELARVLGKAADAVRDSQAERERAAAAEARAAALAESEQQAQQLAAIVDWSDEAIISKDLDGRIITWNRGAEDLFGYAAAEILGKPIAILIPPDRLDEENEILARIRRGERVWPYDTLRRRKDGRLVPVAISVSPIKRADGRIVGASKIARDITARKQTEDALRASEERLRQAQAAAGFGVFDTDLVGGRMMWDARMRALWGLPADVRLTREIVMAGIHPEDRARVEAALARACDPAGAGVYAAEYRVVARDGTERWIAATGQVFFAEGRAARVVGTAMDISERKAAERRQQLLMREVDHRAKNALAVAAGLLRMTKAKTVPEFVDIAQKRVGALARVHSLLAENLWDGAPLDDLIKRELAPFLVQGARVSIAGPPLVIAPASAQAVSMVLHELATNATKYGALSAPQGRVDVIWRATDIDVTLVWKESGGPPVAPPATTGFGMQVIEQVTRYQLEGSVAFDWPETGLVCTFTLPVTCIAGGGGALRPWDAHA